MEKKDNNKEEEKQAQEAMNPPREAGMMRVLDNIENLIEKNVELSEEIKKSVKYVKRYVILSQILGIIKIMIILVPIIIGIIYVPKIVDEYRNNPQKIFDTKWIEAYMEGIVNRTVDNINPDMINIKK